MWSLFTHRALGSGATKENIQKSAGKISVQQLSPCSNPLTPTVSTPWKMISRPIWCAESICTLHLSIASLVLVLQAKSYRFLILGRGELFLICVRTGCQEIQNWQYLYLRYRECLEDLKSLILHMSSPLTDRLEPPCEKESNILILLPLHWSCFVTSPSSGWFQSHR